MTAPAGARRLLRLEAERALVKHQRMLASTDPGQRLVAARHLLTLITVGAAALWAWSRVLVGSGTSTAPSAAAVGLCALLAWALGVDAARRAEGSLASPRRARYEGWLAEQGLPRRALAIRAAAHDAAVVLPVAWVILLPVGPWIAGRSFVGALTIGVAATTPALLGGAAGRTWRGAGRAGRIALASAAAAAIAFVITHLLALDPGLAPQLGRFPVSLLGGAGAALLAPGHGPWLCAAVAVGAFLIGTVAAARELDLSRVREVSLATALGTRGRPYPAATVPALLQRDLLRARRWLRADWLAAAWGGLPPLAAFASLRFAPAAGMQPMLSGTWLPWALTLTSVLPALAFADGVWSGEPRALWRWYRTEMPQPALLLFSRVAVVATVLVSWFALLGVLLAAGGGTHADLLTHAGIGLAAAAGLSCIGLLALIAGIRLGIEETLLGRYLRYVGTIGGLMAPAALLHATGSLPLTVLVSLTAAGLSLAAAVRLFASADFLPSTS